MSHLPRLNFSVVSYFSPVMGTSLCGWHIHHCVNFYSYCFGDSSSTLGFYGWFTYWVILVWGFVLHTFLREDSSSTLWTRPLFLCCGFIHCFRADSSTLISGDLSPWLLCGFVHCWPIKLGFMAVINLSVLIYFGIKRKLLRRPLVWQAFLAAFGFFPWLVFCSSFIFIVITMFGVVSGVFCFFFHCSFADSLCHRSAQVVSAILLPGLLR